MLGSAACFALHLGAPVPGSAGTWISLPIDAQVTNRYAHFVRSRLAQSCPSRANPCEARLASRPPSHGLFCGGISADGFAVTTDPNRPCQSSTDFCRAAERPANAMTQVDGVVTVPG